MKHYVVLLLLSLPIYAEIPKHKTMTAEDLTAYLEQEARESKKSKLAAEARNRNKELFLERFRIRVKNDSCMAANFRTGTCALTVAQFNIGLATQIPHNLDSLPDTALNASAAEIRKRVLDLHLENAFLSESAETKPTWATRKIGSRPVESPSDLRILQLMPYLSRLFPEIKLQVMAASDSAWLQEEFQAQPIRILPVTLEGTGLTDALVSDLVDLKPGDWTSIRKTPFGYVYLSRMDSLDLPTLADQVISRLESYSPPSDADLQRAIREQFRVRANVCHSPDTLFLSLRLNPPARKRGPIRDPEWIRATSLDLPLSLLSYVRHRKTNVFPDTIGPIRSAYGIWDFVLFENKPGAAMDDSTCLAGVRSDILMARKLEFLMTSRHAMAEKSKAPAGPIRARMIDRLKQDGVYDGEAEFKRSRDEWIATSIQLNY
jgi:hypothetical protein